MATKIVNIASWRDKGVEYKDLNGGARDLRKKGTGSTRSDFKGSELSKRTQSDSSESLKGRREKNMLTRLKLYLKLRFIVEPKYQQLVRDDAYRNTRAGRNAYKALDRERRSLYIKMYGKLPPREELRFEQHIIKGGDSIEVRSVTI